LRRGHRVLVLATSDEAHGVGVEEAAPFLVQRRGERHAATDRIEVITAAEGTEGRLGDVDLVGEGVGRVIRHLRQEFDPRPFVPDAQRPGQKIVDPRLRRQFEVAALEVLGRALLAIGELLEGLAGEQDDGAAAGRQYLVVRPEHAGGGEGGRRQEGIRPVGDAAPLHQHGEGRRGEAGRDARAVGAGLVAPRYRARSWIEHEQVFLAIAN
jgi:hypothetical protein